MTTDPSSMIIFPVDFPEEWMARQAIGELYEHVSHFKLGLETITAGFARKLACELIDKGKQVGWDGKFADIGPTVGAASRQVAKIKATWFNVHASSGDESIRAAVENRGACDVYGVTVLTSIDDDECKSIFGDEPGRKVLQFAKMLLDRGAQGIICSPKELAILNTVADMKRLKKATPGVRPKWAEAGAQKRHMTPREAIANGADYIIIGTPISKPPTEFIGGRKQAVALITEEVKLGWADRLAA